MVNMFIDVFSRIWKKWIDKAGKRQNHCLFRWPTPTVVGISEAILITCSSIQTLSQLINKSTLILSNIVLLWNSLSNYFRSHAFYQFCVTPHNIKNIRKYQWLCFLTLKSTCIFLKPAVECFFLLEGWRFVKYNKVAREAWNASFTSGYLFAFQKLEKLFRKMPI